jgi:NAD(P)-dependent dehydrogenase (short-subunit alcohol dehydrogenase family)
MNGRRAIVTGAASGIGRATAVRLSRDGCRLLLLDRDEAGLRSTAAACADAQVHVLDLSRPAETVPRLRPQVDADPVDLLVNCAGVGWAATTAETDASMWDTTIEVNLSATFFMCQLVLPGMLERGGGVIVNIASAGALVGLKNRVAYCASKAGILGLTRAIAADHAADGIRVNAVCPGTVDSPWIGKILKNAEDPEGTRKLMEQRQLDGRMGTPEEVAEWIAFISADTGRFMNGASLVIDGGLTAV